MSSYGWALRDYRDGAARTDLDGNREPDLNGACSAVGRAMRTLAFLRHTDLSDAFWHSSLQGDMETAEGGRKVFPFLNGTSVEGHVWRIDD